MKPEEILRELEIQKFFHDEKIELTELKGGTISKVYLVKPQLSPPLVLKANDPLSNEVEISFLQQYSHVPILPKVSYADPHFRFFLQSYVSGSTGYVTGGKKQLLLTLTEELLSNYAPSADHKGYGFEDELRPTWGGFLLDLVNQAKAMADGFLTYEDYQIAVKALCKIPEPEQVYRIHGDCGAHNFIFGAKGELKGVIDPMPIYGDPLYDLLFAFCSTPEDLTRETLQPACEQFQLRHIDNLDPLLIVSLYIRVSRAIKHQPQHVEAYRAAWTSLTNKGGM